MKRGNKAASSAATEQSNAKATGKAPVAYEESKRVVAADPQGKSQITKGKRDSLF